MKIGVKKILSLLMALMIALSVSSSLDERTFIELRDTAMKASGLLSASSIAECKHDYVITNTGSATCIRSGSVTYTCTICGDTRVVTEKLGHLYLVTSIGWGQATYKCDRCSSTASKSVDYLLENFQDNLVGRAQRTNKNDSCYFDIRQDGYINAKDYDVIRKIEKHRLTNPNANEKTKQVYAYLCSVNGNQTLSAQQESTWMGSADYEMNYVYNNSGKYPAMRGLDYMNDDFSGVNKRAIQWWKKGGLVTICWHTGSDFTGEWNDAMNDTVADWDAMLTEGTAEYDAMIAGIDKAAKALKELEDAGVTVLWRPFHEFDGAWFWWGKGGSQNFVKLWQIMYDRYTNYWGLNNLIWVLGYSHSCTSTSIPKWNPGEDYYDIMGGDSYSTSEYKSLYTKIRNAAPYGKPICLHECGTNPTPTDFESMPWCYFMTWHTSYITNDNTTDGIRTLYNSNRIITLDEISM